MAVARIIPTAANPDLLTYTIKVEGTEVPRTYHIGNISVHKEINKIPSARIKIFDGMYSYTVETLSRLPR